MLTRLSSVCAALVLLAAAPTASPTTQSPRTPETPSGRDWWSFQPVRRPAVPQVDSSAHRLHPIDTFILARLEREGMTQAPAADKRTLARRAYFDLLGLPPTPAQIEAFLRNDAPNAWDQLLDQLLQSPHYGERWARHWLDVVRFAETSGYERDQLKPGIWRYRDWVINALNRDMPYDQFVTHQLAGDEIPDRTEDSVIATGMLRAGTWNDEPNDPADYLYERLEDMVHTSTSAFLALTVKCARCHDHKFDPIPQTDYYRIASFFWAGYLGQENLGGPTKDQLGFDVFGWTDKGPTPPPIHILLKGERHHPGNIVEPGFLSAIPPLDRPLAPPPEGSRTTHRRLQFARWITDPHHPLTARVLVNRLWLHHFGEGLVRSPNNFGLKSDPPTHPELLDWLADEFMRPTPGPDAAHPQPWTLKRMHKLIMTSATYRQASQHPRQADYSQKDSLNHAWWHFNRRRLDAESLRDAMLLTSGRLNPRLGGPSFYPEMSPEALEGLSRKDNDWGHSTPEERSRRSVYMMTKRSRLLPLMTTFDFSDTTLSCAQRDVTTVAPQALALLNNEFVHAQSEALARRLVQEAGPMLPQQINRAWHLAFGRSPQPDETAAAQAHWQSQLTHFQTWLAQQRSREASLEPELKIKLVLWLRADQGVQTDSEGRVQFWRDAARSEGLWPHDASQADPAARPHYVPSAIAGQPALRFHGTNQFLHLAGPVLSSHQFSLFAVVTHRATHGGPREILSNWHRRGRSTTSVFLGTSGATGLRFSDAFAPAGTLTNPATPFFLTAINDSAQASTFQNRTRLASANRLGDRDLHPPYVIGTQGDYGAEWWHGDIAEILAYDRPLDDDERAQVWHYLSRRYGFPSPSDTLDPHHLALASLCHVLLNANEFVYVD